MTKKAVSMKNFVQKIPEQIKRLSIVFFFLAAGVLLARAYLVPTELKESGIHRSKTIQTEISRKGSYSESEVCSECHDDKDTLKRSGFHKFLACETCHGPGAKHAEDPETTPPSAPRERDYCSLCHAYDASRPTGFPQINPLVHNPLKACISCHEPHDPKPTEVPRECSACHGGISRTMAISPHIQLDCTTCHEVPKNHKTTPRAAKPSKPESREFCGKCHAEGSDVKGPPRVDMKTHGEKYLCWQCHYPHMPEAR